MSNLKIDCEYLASVLANLIRINSINPTLVSGGAGEAQIAAFVADTLRGLGMEVALHEVEPRRVSVVGRLKGGHGKTLMLNGHLDTVGIDNMPEPFSAEMVDGKMYGRGAYDMKSGLAACLAAAKAIVDAGVSLSGELQIAAVCDEEYASLGTADVVKRYRPDAAIVTEPTELVISLAHKGFIWIEVKTIGKAAHGSRPQLGIDANMRMGRFLELDQLEQELRARQGHPLIGPPTLHASLIQGGTGLSVISESCKLQIERRTLPGETEAQVVAEIQALIDQLSASDPTFNATVKSFFARDPFEVPEGAAIVKSLDRAATNVLHKPPQHAGVSFWTDAALYAGAGIETVLFGPIGAGAHAREEWVDLQSVEETALILAQTAIEYCR